MTRDEIIRMAREANRYASNQTGDSFEWQEIRDERFAAMIAAAEREACASICEKFPYDCLGCLEDCAAAIRARSNQ